jgi:hypothetical protein
MDPNGLRHLFNLHQNGNFEYDLIKCGGDINPETHKALDNVIFKQATKFIRVAKIITLMLKIIPPSTSYSSMNKINIHL